MREELTTSFEDLTLELIKESSPEGVLKVIKNNLDFHFRVILKPENTKAVVFSNGAFNLKIATPPGFMRTKSEHYYNANCIYIDDRTIHNTSQNLGWGVGVPDRHYLFEYGEIVRKLLELLNISSKDVVYFGSSAGGFMSMALSTYHKGTCAVVNNPQFYASTYANGKSLKGVHQELFSDYSYNDFLLKYSDRISIPKIMSKHKHFPKILVLQNRLCKSDMKFQITPFLKNCEKYNVPLDNIELLLYHKNNGHNPIETSRTAPIVNSILEGKRVL